MREIPNPLDLEMQAMNLQMSLDRAQIDWERAQEEVLARLPKLAQSQSVEVVLTADALAGTTLGNYLGVAIDLDEGNAQVEGYYTYTRRTLPHEFDLYLGIEELEIGRMTINPYAQRAKFGDRVFNMLLWENVGPILQPPPEKRLIMTSEAMGVLRKPNREPLKGREILLDRAGIIYQDLGLDDSARGRGFDPMRSLRQMAVMLELTRMFQTV